MGETRTIGGMEIDLCDEHFENLQTILEVIVSRFRRYDCMALSDRNCRVLAQFVTPSPRHEPH